MSSCLCCFNILAFSPRHSHVDTLIRLCHGLLLWDRCCHFSLFCQKRNIFFHFIDRPNITLATISHRVCSIFIQFRSSTTNNNNDNSSFVCRSRHIIIMILEQWALSNRISVESRFWNKLLQTVWHLQTKQKTIYSSEFRYSVSEWVSHCLYNQPNWSGNFWTDLCTDIAVESPSKQIYLSPPQNALKRVMSLSRASITFVKRGQIT